ncbi:glycosyltransferase [Candidatus Fermentibacterales bacterium]|nr:glycosyltransferase [Candidatus Fermentibacterales bacterium]
MSDLRTLLSVVIPSRNGSSLLREYLPAVLEDARGAEIIVVDDCSEEDLAGLVAMEFPGVRLIGREPPRGFCFAVNEGVEASNSPFVMVLNNDVAPEPGCFAELVSRLESAPAEVFCVVPRIIRPDGSDESRVTVRFRRGLAVSSIDHRGVPYPSGACSLYRREKWGTLGGYSRAYAPIYWEDADLGMRARRAGMRMERVESAVVRHHHAATMGMTSEALTLRERNRIIFTRIHFARPMQRLLHRLWIPLHILSSLVRGRPEFLRGFLEARAVRFDLHGSCVIL